MQSRTDWHDVVVWGPRAEGLGKIVRKGSRVLVEGGLRTSSFEKEGVRRWKTEVHGREVFLLGAPAAGAPVVVEGAPGEAARASEEARRAKGGRRASEASLEDLAF